MTSRGGKAARSRGAASAASTRRAAAPSAHPPRPSLPSAILQLVVACNPIARSPRIPSTRSVSRPGQWASARMMGKRRHLLGRRQRRRQGVEGGAVAPGRGDRPLGRISRMGQLGGGREIACDRGWLRGVVWSGRVGISHVCTNRN